MRLLIIGGSDAGVSAGLRGREVVPTAGVTMLVADAYPNFGIPYHVFARTSGSGWFSPVERFMAGWAGMAGDGRYLWPTGWRS